MLGLSQYLLKKNRSTVPTGMLPLKDIHSAMLLVDMSDIQAVSCAETARIFCRTYGIKHEVWTIDMRELKKEDRDFIDPDRTIIKKDINRLTGRPRAEKLQQLLSENHDLLICMIGNDDYLTRYIAACSPARFKVGRIQTPEQAFDLIMDDPEHEGEAACEVLNKICEFLPKIR